MQRLMGEVIFHRLTIQLKSPRVRAIAARSPVAHGKENLGILDVYGLRSRIPLILVEPHVFILPETTEGPVPPIFACKQECGAGCVAICRTADLPAGNIKEQKR